jgi:threonine/homoserine/homoserine lactone efflux protein
MTLASLAALFVTLALLAAVPSLSVLTVTARALALGPRHGALAAAGIVAGDVFYIVLALFGGAALFAAGEVWADALRVAGAALLGVLAWRQWRAEARVPTPQRHARLSSFAAGLAVTLADAKALLFYLVLLPAFVDVGALSASDIARVLLVAVVAVGGVKLAYAFAATRVAGGLGQRRASALARAAACALALAAVLLLGGLAGPGSAG